MTKKIGLIGIALIGLLLLSIGTAIADDYSLTIQDDSDDVSLNDENLVSEADVDIVEISFSQTGTEVTASLKLKDGGTIQYSEEQEHMYIYTLLIETTHNTYNAYYGYDFEGMEGFLSRVTEEESGAEVDADINVVENGQLTFTFNLLENNEICLTISGGTIEIIMTSVTDYAAYYDIAPELENIIEYSVLPGGPYSGNVSDSITFLGDIDDVDPTDLEWFWVFDDQDLVLKGQEVSHTFKFPDTYSGTLFVLDDKGNIGQAVFQVEIGAGDNTNPSNDEETDNNDENNNLLLFGVLIVIVVIIGLGALIYLIRS